MRKFLTFVTLFCVCLTINADIRVLSNVKLGEGYFPRFADAKTVTYLKAENASYLTATVDENATLRVDNENLELNLYRNGEKVVLKPHGDVNYIWASLSPDQTMILFNTKFGTAVCDLNGKEIVNVGNVNAPVWFGNDYIVGMNDQHDGYYFTSSNIVIASVDGLERQELTDAKEMGYYPNVDANSGRIVYHTEKGQIRLMQLNLTEQPIRKEMPRLVQEVDGTLLNEMKRQAKRAASTNPADYKIYINPGHGGYDSDDRLMYLYPIFINSSVNTTHPIYLDKLKELKEKGEVKADSLAKDYTRRFSFWESVSNLDKGMRLDTMLRDLGFQTKMSRITNTTADDRSLSGIVAEANAYGADFMLSIHSNAGNPSNYILQIHSGITPGDPYGLNGYSDKVPQAVCDEARAITTLMGNNQYMNEVSCWSREPQIVGDKTFARTVMDWSNGYGVLRNLRVPGTISEGMMHDYLPETYRLVNIDYKRQEAFYFAKTFYKYFCDSELPYGAIGGKVHDVYQKQTFPDYKPRKNTRDIYRPINRGVVELWQNNQLIDTYVTDTLYNGCYFFWNLQPGTYIVKTKAEDYYPQEQTLVVENNKISYGIIAVSMKRQSPPEVVAYTPKVELTDSVLVSTQVTISFNWDMNEEATADALVISPAVEGTVTFENDSRTLRFKPAKRFEPGTEYTVTIGTGACHPDTTFDNHLKEPFSFKFRTSLRGNLEVVQTYPADGSTGIPLDAAFITIFDGKLANTANKYLKLYDANGKDISPVARNIKLNGAAPEPYGSARFELKAGTLVANSDYKMVIGGDVVDVNGVLVTDPVTIAFRTGDEVSTSVPMVNSLDTVFFEGDKENSVGVASVSTGINKNSKKEGLASNKFSYTFSEDNGEAVYVADNVTAILGNSNSILGMYINADYSFNTLYAKWAVEGDIQYTKICDLDYAGWLYQEADMSALPAGVDYQFMGFRLVRQSSFLSGKGEVSVDALRVQFEPAVSSDVEQVVMPENTNCKFIENGYLHILLNGKTYNAQGATIRK